MSIELQVIYLFVLALPVATMAWTITHEEIASEFHEYCQERTTASSSLLRRKFFYLFTCEYCLSHYVTVALLLVTRYKLLYTDWRGYLIAGFSLVAVANVYMSFFAKIRLEVKRERVEIKKSDLGL